MKGAQVAKIIIAGSAGTSAMTIFSYALSEVRDTNFKEPVLLAKMIANLNVPIKKEDTRLQGWLLHYGVGIFFAFTYRHFLKEIRPLDKVKAGLIIGALTGVFGMSVWRLTFLLHPKPPVTNYRRFYGQLLVAHVIFGVVTCLFLPRKQALMAAAPGLQKVYAEG
jgi:hypothetical protein